MVLLTTGVASVPSRAAGAGTRVARSIAWSGPRECAAAPDLPARVEAIAGERGKEVDADVEVARAGARFDVLVRVRHARGGEGQRSFSTSTCALAVEGAAAILALSAVHAEEEKQGSADAAAVVPEAARVGPGSGKPSPSPSTSTSTSTSTSASVSAERTTAGQGTRSHFGLVAVASGDAGSIPGAGLGAGVAISFKPFARARLEAEGAAWLDRSVDLPGSPGVGGRFSMTTASARGCYAALAGRLELSPCFGLSMARIEASGVGAEVTRTSDGVFVAPSLGGLAYLKIAGPFGVRFLVEGLVPLSRPSFVIVRGGTVDRASALVARASIGPEVSF